MNDTYYDLASRLEDTFHEIENDALIELRESNADYVELQKQLFQIKGENPFINALIEGDYEQELSSAQCSALGKFIDMYMRLEELERKHLYFRGHTDAFAYLKRINLI